MRKVWSKISLLGLFTCSICCAQGTAISQTPGDEWAKIRTADVGPDASEVTWKCVHTDQPQRTMSADKYIALNAKEWRQQGKTEAEIKQLSDLARQSLLQSQQGMEVTKLLAFVHQGAATRAAVTQGFPYPMSAPAKPWDPFTLSINFYDGKNSIVVSSPAHQPGESLDKVMLIGSLKRDGNDIMPNVGLNNLPSLIGTPLFKDFTLANSSLQDGANDTVILEQRVQQHWGEQLVPLLTRWVISKQTWRPLLEEKRFDFVAAKDVPANQNALRRVRFLNYRQYPGTIWWPGEIVEEQLSGRGPDEKPGIIYDYQLETAKFNNDADLTLLKKPLPVGAQIGDQRFGPGMTVSYVSKGNILTDEEVHKLLEERDGPPPPVRP